ncbi:MAG TPA: T9SS type A sorting domain-containing protein [Ignavibacteriales bacterium]|nr:T9SS type A sorting domain-containing protein [Ignavibacteriales bacterium]
MNKMYKMLLLMLLCFVFLLPSLILQAEGKNKKDQRKLSKTLGLPNRTKMNINNVSTWIYNNGDSDLDPTQNAGFTYPKGSGKTAIFESGFIWGASVGGEIRVGGSTYRTGLQPGKILSPGKAENPDLDKNRIYRVRPDYKTASLTTEAKEENMSEDEVRAQYEKDWNEWPATDGAPFEDLNNNGTYEPASDIPGFPGASQTIWYVANDLNSSLTTNLYGSQPMGIEMQATMWAYSQAGPLSNMFFRKYVIINKSTTDFKDMYVSMWSDPDVGNATDDYAGCDTILSLGYAYNATPTDATYGAMPPPAVGFDFFQGPVVAGTASDSAITGGRVIKGKKNLPMTAFYYFARGNLNVTDPTLGSYEGTQQFYNFMQGRVGKTGEIFKTPQGVPTTFALPGDPVTGTGWIDGQIIGPDDRRLGLASGPFTMAVGDTQEIVVAEMAAEGSDNLQSVKLLKSYDIKAQDAYNSFFKIPTGAPAPSVVATPLDREVLLSWGNPSTAQATESYNTKGFKFQGYNVYQLPSASATFENAKLIATFDIKDTVGVIYGYVFDPRTGKPELVPIQFGTNSGIQRSIKITKDYINNLPLNNGSRYYFAVTSYSFNPDPNEIPNVLENPLAIITVVPQSNNPGVRYPVAYGDTVKAINHVSGVSDAGIYPIIIDPSKLTGHTYRVTFQTPGDTMTVWSVTDSTTGKVIESNQTNLNGGSDYFNFDGIQLVVTGPPPGMKDYQIPSGSRKWTWSNADGFGLEGFNGAMGNAANNWFSGSTIPVTALPHTLIKLATTDTLGNILNPADSNASFGYRYLRGASSPAAKPEFAPFIKNPTAGYAYQDFTKSVPFAAFNNETGQRLAVGYLENNTEKGLVDGKYWPSDGTLDNTATDGPREWFFIFGTPYTETPDTALTKDILDNTVPMLWMGTPNRRGNVAFEAGDQFLIIANKVIQANDVFTFTAPTVTSGDMALAKQDVQSINVFPNPYYGVNPQELNKYQRFVTFNHLPQNATIRIYNVAGTLIKTISRTGATSQFERWDLANEAGLPVASGIYLALIEMPGLGSKILKIAVIQEQQVLDRF